MIANVDVYISSVLVIPDFVVIMSHSDILSDLGVDIFKRTVQMMHLLFTLEKKLDLYLQYICSTYVSNIICAYMCYICAPALNFIFAPYAHWSVGDYR